MILAIDIGNTNTVIGGMQDGRILFRETVSTVQTAATLEYAALIRTAFELNGADHRTIDGGIISSVVPSLTLTVKEAVSRLTGITPIVVGPGIKTGLSIMIDNPAQLGSGMVVNAAAGIRNYPLPLIIIDIGTATTLSVIDRKGNHIGGMIVPGLRVSLDSLVTKASQLPRIALEPPKRIIGRNTVECLKSGVLYGCAGMIDGLIGRINEEMGEVCTAVATGDAAGAVIPLCRSSIIIDDDLALKGLMIIYEKNM
ncbi:MAG: type III pantothenate kinase [Huintestinicola sp.]|uniref:type III pantothenate kinase n=1 Tax=Huintestinicola sp. TaxID=2981661 RepID=UPI003F04657E